MHPMLSCLALTLAVMASAAAEQKVLVEVYYESLCPDSRKFFTSQLYPSLLNSNVSQWVNLTLVPYGKSSKSRIDDQWVFTCHHGAYECAGNKIQACALHEIETLAPTAGGEGFNSFAVAFINCLMDKVENRTLPGQEPKFVFPIASCAQINKVPNYVNIENCQNHPDGSKYLADLGDKTEKLSPALSSVPTIIFNGKYSKENSDLAQKNFVKALCQYIPKDKPAECKDAATSLALSSLLVVALAFTSQLF